MVAEDHLVVDFLEDLAVLLGLELVDHVVQAAVVRVVADHGPAAVLGDEAHGQGLLLELPGLAEVPAAVRVLGDEIEVGVEPLALGADVARVGDDAMGVGGLHHRGVAVHAQEARLVAHGPEDDAGVVVVLQDHLARDGVARRLDLALVGMAVLRPHQHALLVGQVVFERGVGVMGEADVVDPEVLEPRPLLPQIVVADRGEVRLRLLVLADAAQPDGSAVEGEALAVEAEVAEAEALGQAIRGVSVHDRLRVHGVEPRVRGAPELGPGDTRGRDHLAPRARLHGDRPFQRRHLRPA
jgi:hypothetical protein